MNSPAIPLPRQFDSAYLPQSEAGQAIVAPILLQYFHVAQRWKWVIGGIIVGALVLGIVATLLMTPKYVATSRIEISRDQKNITKVEGVESDDAGRNLEFYQTQYSLLEARSLAERVTRRLGLAANVEFFETSRVSFDQDGGMLGGRVTALSGGERLEREKAAIKILMKNIAISPIRGSALIDINYTSVSPEMAARIANAWTQEFIAASMDRRFASTNDARKFLEQRLADLRLKLEESERSAVNYATEKGIVTLSRTQTPDGRTQSERTLASADLEAINEALTRATADRVAAESKLHSAAGAGATTEALTNVAISQLRQRRAEVASDYAKMLVQFEPEYPQAKALREQIRALDASITREESRVSSGRTSEYQEAVKRESDLRARVNDLRSSYDDQQRSSIQYNIYQRDADTNRQLYDALLQRYKEIGVAGVGANNIAIVDPADIPIKPSSPNLPINLAIALFLGLVAAVIATIALDQVDEGLRDPAQVNRFLNVPLLGSVPAVQEDALLALADPKSALSEAYFSVRSNLAFSTDHGVPKTFMVTSTRSGEGKSTTSFALAAVLGRTGKSVILLDADMRLPSVHEYAGMQNDAGLSNYLSGDSNWQAMVKATQMRGLSIMSAGPTPPSAAELLSGDRLDLLIKELGAHFDHVIIDSPPILGLADAPLVARAVEGCVFVAEAEGVAVRGIKASIGRLQAVQAHIFGVVVSKLNSRDAGYGYGYGYGYGKDHTTVAAAGS